MTSGTDNCIKMWVFDSPDGTARLLRSREGHRAPPRAIRYYGNTTLATMAEGAGELHRTCGLIVCMKAFASRAATVSCAVFSTSILRQGALAGEDMANTATTLLLMMTRSVVQQWCYRVDAGMLIVYRGCIGVCYRCDGVVRAFGRHGPLFPGFPHGQGLPEPGAVSKAARQGKRLHARYTRRTAWGGGPSCVQYEIPQFVSLGAPSDSLHLPIARCEQHAASSWVKMLHIIQGPLNEQRRESVGGNWTVSIVLCVAFLQRFFRV